MAIEDDIQAVLACERRRGEALVRRDARELDALFADELVHIHATGDVMDKAQLLHYVLQVLQFLSLERGELRVRVHGDVAIMTGRMQSRMQRVGKPEPVASDAWATQVWLRTPLGWRLASFHACRAAAPA